MSQNGLFALHGSSVLDGRKEKEQCVCSPEKFVISGRCATLTHLSQTESFQTVPPTFKNRLPFPQLCQSNFMSSTPYSLN